MIHIILKNDMLPIKIELPDGTLDKHTIGEMLKSNCENDDFLKIQKDMNSEQYIINTDMIAYIYID